MANVYAVKTGNWSDITLWNTGALPTSSDDVFSNTYTVTIDQDITVLSLRNTAQTPAVAGGGFILDGTYIVTATGQGLVTGATRLLTYTGSNSVINGNIIGSTTTAGIESLFHNSTGTLTINGNISNISTSPSITIVRTNSTGTLNINGNILSNGWGVNLDIITICTVNIVGNVTRELSFRRGNVINITAQATVNITGNVTQLSNANGNFIIINNNISATINITGNVVSNNNNGATGISNSGFLNVTGNVFVITNNGSHAINNSGYLTIVGAISTFANQTAVFSGSGSAINFFSGPFICSTYGFFPYQVVRMHLIPSASSYIEFRDETTGGALAPSSAAPATQLISPSAIVGNLPISDVRFGTTYAIGSLTGTLRMPHPNHVSFGTPVDDTFGNLVLTVGSIWNYPVDDITVQGSIGMRLKNVATPQSVGEQLEAFLRLD